MRANALPRALLKLVTVSAVALMGFVVSPALSQDLTVAYVTPAELTPELAASRLAPPPVPLRGSFSAAQPELTIAQFRVLARLQHAPQTNKQLADWIGISTPSMCRTVDVLEKKALVERSAGQKDRREILVTLTAKGREKFSGFKSITQKKITAKLAGLSEKDRKELMTGLTHLRGVFEP